MSGSRPQSSLSASSPSDSKWLRVLLLLSVFYAAFFVLRYGGLWTENDTSVFTSTTNQLIASRSVLFPGEYYHGFGYPAWLAALCLETGLSPIVVNSVIAPFLGAILFIPAAFTLYERLLDSRSYAAVAVFALLAVPELMFTVLRGNHEKLNVLYILAAIYAVIWSIDAIRARRGKDIAVASILFYLCVFGNGVVNDYFGILTVVETALAGGLLWIFRSFGPGNALPSLLSRRHLSVGLIALLVMLWVMVFLFPESGADTSLLYVVLFKFSRLFSSIQSGANPYVIASSQWATPFINILMSLFHWMVLTSSVLAFLPSVFEAVKRRSIRDEEALLWAVYLSFGLLVAVAIPVDFFGLGAGSNLEVRNYTYFTLAATPMAAVGIRRWMAPWRTGRIAVAVIYCAMLLMGLGKATLDPIVSNYWMFYTAGEREALTTFSATSTSTGLWVGPDNRLVYTYDSLGLPTNQNQVNGYNYLGSPFDVDFLLSSDIEASAWVLQEPLPNTEVMNRVFDDGETQIYRKAPRSYLQN